MICRNYASIAILVHFFLLASATSKGDSGVPDGWTEIGTNITWCGAKALSIVDRHYGGNHSLEQILALCDPDGKTTGLLSIGQLASASEKLGLYTYAVHCEPEWLRHSRLPALTVNRTSPDAQSSDKEHLHYTILVSTTDDAYHIIDPFLPNRIQAVSRHLFDKTFTGHALIISNTPDGLPTSYEPMWLIGLTFLSVIALLFFIRMFPFFRTGVPRTARLLSLVFVFASLVVYSGCSRSSAKATGLSFEPTEHDAGPIIADDTLIVHRYPFVNRTSHPIRILEAVPGCSCTKINFPKDPILPNGSGFVDAAINITGRVGPFGTTVLLKCDEASSPHIRLSYKCFVVPRVRHEPVALEFNDIPSGATREQELTMRVSLKPDEKPPIITSYSGQNTAAGVDYQLVSEDYVKSISGSSDALVPSSLCRIKAVITAKDAGSELDDILTIHLRDRPPVSVYLHANVIHPTISLTPRSINFGSFRDAAVVREVSIRSIDGKPVPGITVQTTDPQGIRVSVDKSKTNPSTAILTAVVDPKQASQSYVDGFITVTPHDSGIPCRIPYTGYFSSKE